MTEIGLSPDNTAFELKGGVLFSRADSTLVSYLSANPSAEYAVLEGTKHIESFAFTNCDHLERVTIPDGALSIGSYSFNECDKLTSVAIPSSVTDIGYTVFLGNPNLVLTVEQGANAEQYAVDNGLAFVYAP